MGSEITTPLIEEEPVAVEMLAVDLGAVEPGEPVPDSDTSSPWWGW